MSYHSQEKSFVLSFCLLCSKGLDFSFKLLIPSLQEDLKISLQPLPVTIDLLIVTKGATDINNHAQPKRELGFSMSMSLVLL